MKPLSIEQVSSFFDEIQEEWLTPFDWNPNERLPHSSQRVYRIKDLFIDTYRKKICKYTVDEIEHCRVRFHTIFADNRLYALQAYDETNKLKLMADGDHYYLTTIGNRKSSGRSSSTDNSTDSSTNKRKASGKTGQLTGSVDAIQLGSVLDETERVIDTNKLPDFFDRNVRGYNQGVNVDDTVEDVVVNNTSNYTTEMTNEGASQSQGRRGVEAMNTFRARSLNVRRLREEFIQCFNVLYW